MPQYVWCTFPYRQQFPWFLHLGSRAIAATSSSMIKTRGRGGGIQACFLGGTRVINNRWGLKEQIKDIKAKSLTNTIPARGPQTEFCCKS